MNKVKMLMDFFFISKFSMYGIFLDSGLKMNLKKVLQSLVIGAPGKKYSQTFYKKMSISLLKAKNTWILDIL